MTYFELIKNLKILTKEKRNEEAYNRFMNSDIILYTDMNLRLAIQLVNFIRTKIDETFKEFTNRLLSKEISEEEFSTQVIDLRNELIYLQNFTNIKYLTPKCNEDLKELYNNLTDEYNEMFTETINEIYGDTYERIYNELLKRNEGVN